MNAASEEVPAKTKVQEPAGEVRNVVAIELGTTSVRMAVGQAQPDGTFSIVDNLQQAVSLGKDAFTRGYIELSTAEECVKAMRNFRTVLQEYRITDDRQIRAVATSAVREASNREAFLDRIFGATGLNVEVIDSAEISRFTYLAVHPVLEAEPALKQCDLLVMEVGGGSTECLYLQQGQVQGAETYRLGSLRLRKTLEDQPGATSHLRKIMELQVDRTSEQMKRKVAGGEALNMLAMGADARFACAQLSPEWDRKSLGRMPVPALSKLTDKLLDLSVDDLVKQYHVTYPDAETLGPALLAYVRIARELGIKQILVASVNLRGGILAEMATRGPWSEEFKTQIIHSSIAVGKKYDFDQEHAEQVADMAGQLYRGLQNEHLLDARYGLIFTIAALLHEIGSFVSNRSHHKHSMYLIVNSDIFGLGAKDLKMAALIARYHRRALPSPSHDLYNTLDRHDRVTVAKLAAILRVADALARGTSRQKRMLQVTVEPRDVIITVAKSTDLTLEEHNLRQKRPMFESVYGKRVILRAAGG